MTGLILGKGGPKPMFPVISDRAREASFVTERKNKDGTKHWLFLG